MRRTSTRSGFTILEVVLALSILLIGMTTVLGLLSFGAALAHTAEQRTSAALAIESVIADLEENLFPLEVVEGVEVVGDPVPIVDREIPGARGGLVYSATASPAPGGDSDLPDAVPLEYRVDVEVTWTAGGVRRSTTFRTLLPRQVPFGERLRRRFVQGAEAPRAAPPTTEPEPDSRR